MKLGRWIFVSFVIAAVALSWVLWDTVNHRQEQVSRVTEALFSDIRSVAPFSTEGWKLSLSGDTVVLQVPRPAGDPIQAQKDIAAWLSSWLTQRFPKEKKAPSVQVQVDQSN